MCGSVGPSPTVSWPVGDESGEEPPASDSTTVIVQDFQNAIDTSIDLNYEFRTNSGGAGGFEERHPILKIAEGLEDGGLEKGDARINEFYITYTLADETYVDTRSYVSSLADKRCCTQYSIDYDSFDYRGELFESFERRRDLPGFFVRLRRP